MNVPAQYYPSKNRKNTAISSQYKINFLLITVWRYHLIWSWEQARRFMPSNLHTEKSITDWMIMSYLWVDVIGRFLRFGNNMLLWHPTIYQNKLHYAIMRLEDYYSLVSWWRHPIKTYSALLAICAGNSPVPGEFPTKASDAELWCFLWSAPE